MTPTAGQSALPNQEEEGEYLDFLAAALASWKGDYRAGLIDNHYYAYWARKQSKETYGDTGMWVFK